MAAKVPFVRRIVNTLASVRTGIILLIIAGAVAAAGTIILQRPITEPAVMERAYSPQVLAWLDRLGLTDVFHTWWWSLLLALLAASIVLASLERFPNAWRYYARPYRRPDSHFRAVLPQRKEFPISDAGAGLDVAERAFRSVGLTPERVVDNDEVSLYAERARFSVLGAYVVHVALLLILGGYIVDSVVGYRGYVQLVKGQQSDQIDVQGAGARKLPFALRCDNAGQENYPDGTPKKYWSNLTVIENGREALKKEIIVNDPLVYRGVRFYQSSFGNSGELQRLRLAVVVPGQNQPSKVLDLAKNGSVTLDDGSTLRLVRFIPDAFRMDDGEIYQRSRDLNNAAAELQLTKTGVAQELWLFLADQGDSRAVVLSGPYDKRGMPATSSPYQFVANVELAPFTGLQVSYEPGQWGIWGGIVLMAVGLAMAFYFVHLRFWALPVKDEKGGLTLWVGAAASKNRYTLEERFAALTIEIEKELSATKVRAAGAGR